MTAAFFLACLPVSVAAPGAAGQEGVRIDRDPGGVPYVSGELIVTYEEDSAEAERPAGAPPRLPRGAEVEEDLPAVDAQLVEFPAVKEEGAGERREELLEIRKEEISSDPAVEAVDYNYLRSFAYAPNDRRFGEQWSLRKIGAPAAWDETRGKRGVKIGVVDSGIKSSHKDLDAKVALQHDFVSGDGVAEDRAGHGTAVAGVAAAETDNRIGVAGACPNCRLLVAGIERDGLADTAAGIRGILWAAKRGAAVINLSYAGEGRVEAEARAVAQARRKGAVVVASAGNEAREGNPILYPAAHRGVLAVAATNSRDRRAGFSSYGPWVDLTAPGVNVTTTYRSGYARLSGTSFSSPLVAGTAGLLASRGLNAAAIERRLLSSAKDIGPKGRDPFYGTGRLDAAEAVGR